METAGRRMTAHKRPVPPVAGQAAPPSPVGAAGRPDPFAPPADGSGHPHSPSPAVRPSATAGEGSSPGLSAIAAGPDPLPAGGAARGRGPPPAGTEGSDEVAA